MRLEMTTIKEDLPGGLRASSAKSLALRTCASLTIQAAQATKSIDHLRIQP